MDKIKNSDKFNHLRLNIKAGNRLKPNGNIKENLIKNITGINPLKDQRIKSATLSQSPRRRPETKKIDFVRLHCSINTTKNDNNKNRNPHTKSGLHEETRSNSFRNDALPSVPAQKRLPFVERLERDASGFLKPCQPAPKKNIGANHVEEEMKTFNSLMLRLTDQTIFRELEIIYHSEKIFNHIKKTACKLMMKSKSNESTSTDNISHSLFQLSRGIPDGSGSRMDINKSRQIFSHLNDHSVVNNVNVFLLKDWGVIKGSGKKDLMVTGMLIDAWSRKVIELNHVSSCIIEKTGNNCVRTVCCSYQLTGKFVEGEQRLQPEIKQFFTNDNFPDNWELVAAKWHSMNLLNYSLANRKNMKKNLTNKRSLEDLLCKNEDNSVVIKKLKPNNNRFHHETTNVRGRTEGTPEQSALNLSVQTRSAVRKNRLPIFLG